MKGREREMKGREREMEGREREGREGKGGKEE